MSPESVERRLAAIFSADAVGYSALMAADEAATAETLRSHRDAMSGLVRTHGGRVVDAVGDNLLAEFPSVVDAVACAVEVQGELGARNATLPSERRLPFRIGVNLGDLIVEGERVVGDGVNVAARIQTIAEPGGLAISGTVHEQVRGKLSHAWEDLGERSLKNLAHPVRVYRTRCAPDPRADEAAKLTVPGFAGRPAIAVLAFDNLSGDPDQEFLADGIAEDLITRLSSARLYPVIARNSSFVYKGRAVDVKQVSSDLGVRYVVEGSVRRAGDRVRISAQLIDATSGHHVWAERYDRRLEDVFALQDEITQAIVVAIHPELAKVEGERALRGDPISLDAWECAQRGWWHFNQMTQSHNAEARELLERAIALDPRFGWAHFVLSQVHYCDLFFEWTDSPERCLAEVLRAAQACASLDPKDAHGQVALAVAYSLMGQRSEVIAAAERAMELNPSLPMAYLIMGSVLGVTGRPDEGIAVLEKGMRLSPQDPWLFDFLNGVGFAHFAAGRYEEAVEWERRSLQHKPDYVVAYDAIAASLAQLGRLDEARQAFAERVRRGPAPSLEHLEQVLAFADPDFRARFVDGLRKAGLPG